MISKEIILSCKEDMETVSNIDRDKFLATEFAERLYVQLNNSIERDRANLYHVNKFFRLEGDELPSGMSMKRVRRAYGYHIRDVVKYTKVKSKSYFTTLTVASKIGDKRKRLKRF